MTNHWVDIKNANLVVVMGGNAAEAHPVGFRWAMEAKIHNGAKLIVIDPRFTRTAAVADFYTPIRSGTDITFLSGVILYLLNNEKINREYTEAYTNASLIVREDYSFEDGLFSGYDAEARKYDKTSWNYELDENGFAKRDTTLQHPRCVWNLLKQHVSRYTPEVVENICGTPKADFLKVCEYIAETSAHDKTASFLYALGWTQHSIGAQNIRTMAMIQLLLGNMGMAGGGVNALRGHSNIQGLTDLGLLSQSLPGYMTLPSEKQTDLQTYLAANTPKPLLKGQVNYWGNYPKFFVPVGRQSRFEKIRPVLLDTPAQVLAWGYVHGTGCKHQSEQVGIHCDLRQREPVSVDELPVFSAGLVLQPADQVVKRIRGQSAGSVSARPECVLRQIIVPGGRFFMFRQNQSLFLPHGRILWYHYFSRFLFRL